MPRAAQQAKGLLLRAVLVYSCCVGVHMLGARALQRHIILVQASMSNHVQEDHMRLLEVLNALWIPGRNKQDPWILSHEMLNCIEGILGLPKGGRWLRALR